MAEIDETRIWEPIPILRLKFVLIIYTETGSKTLVNTFSIPRPVSGRKAISRRKKEREKES